MRGPPLFSRAGGQVVTKAALPRPRRFSSPPCGSVTPCQRGASLSSPLPAELDCTARRSLAPSCPSYMILHFLARARTQRLFFRSASACLSGLGRHWTPLCSPAGHVNNTASVFHLASCSFVSRPPAAVRCLPRSPSSLLSAASSLARFPASLRAAFASFSFLLAACFPLPAVAGAVHVFR